ncbi:MAG: CopD family protein [Hyphomonas sp.]|nr:CopD family protein [Hyphomonas sp.]MCB9961907.1 CopD family protein [Hyphomonas sp.]MCB9970901.1 CopD family protein [Hyphomonas sp.]
MLYNWIKAAHVIFVIATMAGLMIYPRYKIHQLSSQPGEPLFETMKESAKRLKNIIMNPSIVLIWVFGGLMLWMHPALLSQPWMHVKLVLVTLISAMHGYFVGIGKRIDKGTSTITARKLRMLNEVPFVMMIGVVIMVIVRPF